MAKALFCMTSVFSSFVLLPAFVKFMEPLMMWLSSITIDLQCILPPKFSTFTSMPSPLSVLCMEYLLPAALASRMIFTLTPLFFALISSCESSLWVR